jgi:UDP-N-acetylglucosamine 1-carboxyvinyltransferase
MRLFTSSHVSMSHLAVHRGRPLRGTITPSANKNAVLPVLCATLPTDDPVVPHRVPDIPDVRKRPAFFRSLGSSVDMDFASGTLKLQHRSRQGAGDVRLPAGMRSSSMLVPAMLQRFGRVRLEDDVTGCTLGIREAAPWPDVPADPLPIRRVYPGSVDNLIALGAAVERKTGD